MFQIQSFIVTAECLNISKAAEKLFISQPALSRKISKIEQELNCQLFRRGSQKLELTESAKELLVEFKNIYLSYNNALTRTNCFTEPITGTLRVDVLDGMIIGDILGDTIKRFSEMYPEISTEIYNCDYHQIIEKLIDKTIDVAFSLLFDVEHHDILNTKVIADTQCNIAINSSHHYANEKRLNLRDLKEDPFVIVDIEKSKLTHALILAACRQSGFEPIINFVPTRITQMLAVQINKGVCVFDTRNQLTTDPYVRFLELNDYICDPSLTMVWNKTNSSLPRDLFETVILSTVKNKLS